MVFELREANTIHSYTNKYIPTIKLYKQHTRYSNYEIDRIRTLHSKRKQIAAMTDVNVVVFSNTSMMQLEYLSTIYMQV